MAKTKSVTVMLTNDCNLRCEYCYECYKEKNYIQKDTLINIIDEQMNLLKTDGCEYEQVEFNMFGGEPFLAFDLIRFAYEYLEKNYVAGSWIIAIVTNGTLVHEKIQEWLLEHENVICTLSLDGTPEMHNANRNNSFDRIDLEFFKKLKNCSIKMTVSRSNICKLSEGVIFCLENGFKTNTTLSYGQIWKDEDCDELSKQLDIISDYIFERKDLVKRCSIMDFPYETIYNTKGKFIRGCSIGCGATYNYDGKIYPCHMLLPSATNEKQKEMLKTLEMPSNVIKEEVVDNKCKNCPIFSVCNKCFADSFLRCGNWYTVDPLFCKINKILFKKKANLYLKLWENKLLDIDETKEYMLLDSIMTVLNNIGD